MTVRCKNCDLEFSADASRLGSAGSVPCPDCGVVNHLRSKQVDSVSGVNSVTCASCALPMVVRTDHAVPMCFACSGKSDPRVIEDDNKVQWMIRKSGKKVYGPYDGRTVRQWISAGKIEASDEIAVVGSKWKPFFETPPFTSSFTKQSKGEAKKKVQAKRKARAVKKQKKERKKIFINLGEHLKKVAAVGVAGASIGFAYYSIENPMFIVPEPYVEDVKAFTQQVVKKVSGDEKAPPINVVRTEAISYIEGLKKVHGEVKETSTSLRLRGRTLYISGGLGALGEARALLEKAVIANSRDAYALAGLAEIYSDYVSAGDTSLSQGALRMADRAFQMSSQSAEVLRARGHFLASTGAEKEGRELLAKATEKNPKDGFAYYLLGRAWLAGKQPKREKAIEALLISVELNGNLEQAVGLLGQTYLENGDYREASDALRAKLRLKPGDVQANFLFGQLYETVGEGNKALEHYGNALSSSRNNHLESLVGSGILNLQWRQNARVAREHLQRAVQHKDFKNLPLDKQKSVHLQLSNAHRILRELNLAMLQADAALAIEPNYAPAIFAKGLAQLLQRNYGDADQLLKRASALEPQIEGRTIIRYALGMLAKMRNKAGESIGHFQDAINSDSAFVPAYVHLASTYLAAGQGEQADKTLDKLVLLDPNRERHRQYRTQTYYQQVFDLQGVEAPFAQVAKAKYYVPSALANYGVMLYFAGKQAPAVQQLRRALKGGQSARAAFFLGQLQLSSGSLSGALQSFKQATQLNPSSGIYWTYLGEMQLQNYLTKEAKASFKRAQQYALNSPQVLYGLAQLHMQENRKQDAKMTFLQVLQTDKDFVAARRQLFQYNL